MGRHIAHLGPSLRDCGEVYDAGSRRSPSRTRGMANFGKVVGVSGKPRCGRRLISLHEFG